MVLVDALRGAGWGGRDWQDSAGRRAGRGRLGADPAGRLVWGQCVDLGADGIPYAPFLPVLRALATDMGGQRLGEVLGPGRAELARLLPELGAAAAIEPEVGRGRSVRGGCPLAGAVRCGAAAGSGAGGLALGRCVEPGAVGVPGAQRRGDPGAAGGDLPFRRDSPPPPAAAAAGGAGAQPAGDPVEHRAVGVIRRGVDADLPARTATGSAPAGRRGRAHGWVAVLCRGARCPRAGAGVAGHAS